MGEKMTTFSRVVSEIGTLLARDGYKVKPTSVRAVFAKSTFPSPILAIPDVHLGDGRIGTDIFLHNQPEKATRLASVLRAIRDFQAQHPLSSRAVQLGDWFDVWRVAGHDASDMDFGAIENAKAYREILDLDAQIGLAHVIGNHDASFVDAVPNRRAQQTAHFRLGFWLGSNVYALHGHQNDMLVPPGQPVDAALVYLATVIGGFTPGMTTLQAFVDRLSAPGALATWLHDGLRTVRGDPGAIAPRRDDRTLPTSITRGTFAADPTRVKRLVKIVREIEKLAGSAGRRAEVIIVGHSHTPSLYWTSVGGRTVVVADAGAWVYSQANFLVAADDSIAVFDVVARA